MTTELEAQLSKLIVDIIIGGHVVCEEHQTLAAPVEAYEGGPSGPASPQCECAPCTWARAALALAHAPLFQGPPRRRN